MMEGLRTMKSRSVHGSTLRPDTYRRPRGQRAPAVAMSALAICWAFLAAGMGATVQGAGEAAADGEWVLEGRPGTLRFGDDGATIPTVAATAHVDLLAVRIRNENVAGFLIEYEVAAVAWHPGVDVCPDRALYGLDFRLPDDPAPLRLEMVVAGDFSVDEAAFRLCRLDLVQACTLDTPVVPRCHPLVESELRPRPDTVGVWVDKQELASALDVVRDAAPSEALTLTRLEDPLARTYYRPLTANAARGFPNPDFEANSVQDRAPQSGPGPMYQFRSAAIAPDAPFAVSFAEDAASPPSIPVPREAPAVIPTFLTNSQSARTVLNLTYQVALDVPAPKAYVAAGPAQVAVGPDATVPIGVRLHVPSDASDVDGARLEVTASRRDTGQPVGFASVLLSPSASLSPNANRLYFSVEPIPRVSPTVDAWACVARARSRPPPRCARRSPPASDFPPARPSARPPGSRSRRTRRPRESSPPLCRARTGARRSDPASGRGSDSQPAARDRDTSRRRRGRFRTGRHLRRQASRAWRARAVGRCAFSRRA